MKIGEEDVQLIILFDWLRFTSLYDVSFHVANERLCSYAAGKLLRRKGVKEGVSDVFILRPSPCGNHHGLIIELKTKKNGKLSLAQKDFLKKMNDAGYCARVCYSAEEAIDLICDYFNMVNPHKLIHPAACSAKLVE